MPLALALARGPSSSRVELVAGAVVQLLELELRVELEGEGGGVVVVGGGVVP